MRPPEQLDRLMHSFDMFDRLVCANRCLRRVAHCQSTVWPGNGPDLSDHALARKRKHFKQKNRVIEFVCCRRAHLGADIRATGFTSPCQPGFVASACWPPPQCSVQQWHMVCLHCVCPGVHCCTGPLPHLPLSTTMHAVRQRAGSCVTRHPGRRRRKAAMVHRHVSLRRK
jgi:hypothetical protein